ncbi:hypothetical protein RB653_005454 [Dictyostelium firmibasis]|uniref:CLASP N-terminal domain-containing protein n=1 Tax=Dictyostelium firmibasis TaxID=79012 RepID=A0AAN7Z137_9MYCE
MKTSRLSTVPTSSSSSSSSSSTSGSSGGTTNTVGSRLFTSTKVDTSPLDFENEKELQKKLDDIVSDFKNKDKEWTFRLKSLQILQRIINGNGIEFKGWSSMLRTISPALIEQLTELRSTIVKEACASVSLLGFRMKSKFEPFALQYTQALIRMVPVKTTIISESAHQTLKDILESVATKNLLQTFLDASLDQHNEQLRKRASEYIYIVLSRAIENDGMLLVSSVPALEKSIQKLLIDGASETRQMARYCFWAYTELNEKNATTLFYTHFTPTTQKNLFTVQEHLKGDQLEFCEKLKTSLYEEEQHQKMVEDSNDLDLDFNDFKKDSSSTTTSSNDNSTRSKTPTTGRTASGLKIRSTPSTPGSTGKIGGATSSTDKISLRSGSSLGSRIDSGGGSGGVGVGSSIKRPLDASNIIRSKSSLGTTRKDVIAGGSGISGSSSTIGGGGGGAPSMQSPLSKTPTTMITKTASSSSPNLATTTQSGRYSSIGTRAITTSLSKQSSSSNLTRSLPPINKSPVSPPSPAPPAPTLTKSKSTPSSPLSTPTSLKPATTTNTISTPTRRISSSTTSSPIGGSSGSNSTTSLKRPPTLSSTPKSSSTTTTTTSSSTKTPSTTTTTTTPSATKKSFITKTTSDENDNTKPTTTTPKPTNKTTTSSLLLSSKRRSDNVDEIDLESLEISLNQDNKLAFNEISDEMSNNLRDAKKGLSFYEKELTLDDLENNNNSNSNSNSNSNNNSKRSSVSSFTNSIKESTTADVDFNWLEDSVHDSLIDEDVLDFDGNNNSTYIPRNNIIKEEEYEQQQKREQQEVLDEDDDELMF